MQAVGVAVPAVPEPVRAAVAQAVPGRVRGAAAARAVPELARAAAEPLLPVPVAAAALVLAVLLPAPRLHAWRRSLCPS